MTDLDEQELLSDPNYPHVPPYQYDDHGFIRYVNDLHKWQIETFGPDRSHVALVDHIKKELDEVLKDPSDLMEWIDIIILALGGAGGAGYSGGDVADALYEKLEICRARTWPDWRTADPTKAIEHVRD